MLLTINAVERWSAGSQSVLSESVVSYFLRIRKYSVLYGVAVSRKRNARFQHGSHGDLMMCE